MTVPVPDSDSSSPAPSKGGGGNQDLEPIRGIVRIDSESSKEESSRTVTSRGRSSLRLAVPQTELNRRTHCGIAHPPRAAHDHGLPDHRKRELCI